MPIVNYIVEHTAFIEYASDNGLTGNEQLLWYALLHIVNRNAQNAYWPDGFIRITNKKLLSYLPMQVDAMAKARNSLKQRGLLEVIPGKRNTDAPAYKLHFFSCQQNNPQEPPAPVDNLSTIPCYTAKTYNTGGNNPGYAFKTYNMGDNMGGNIGDNMQDNTGDIHNRLNETETQTQTETVPVPFPIRPLEENDDDDDSCACAYTQARARERQHSRKEATAEARRAFALYFGRPPTPEFCNQVGAVAVARGLSVELVEIAIKKAAKHQAADPCSYVLRIFDEWAREHVTTEDEYVDYQVAYDFGWLRPEQREARKKAHEAAKGGGTDGHDTPEGLPGG